ncbi:MAG: hypothetical protein J7L07_02820 [Candidatus Odinarchaeota archaeon]|nr:hypothetical protein [Candidatus Odinarchaeota archaeon]
MTPHEVATLGLYYYFLKKGKERKDIKQKALAIKKKYNWSDEEFEKMIRRCYEWVMES